jgi:hypothetical protein
MIIPPSDIMTMQTADALAAPDHPAQGASMQRHFGCGHVDHFLIALTLSLLRCSQYQTVHAAGHNISLSCIAIVRLGVVATRVVMHSL